MSKKSVIAKIDTEVLNRITYKPIRNPLGDYDRDGVVNIFDCAPFDPTRDGKLWESVKKAAKKGVVMTGKAAVRGAVAVKERAGEELREYGKRRKIERQAYFDEMRRLSKERGKERAEARASGRELRQKLLKVKFRDKTTGETFEEIMTKPELNELREDPYVSVLRVERYREPRTSTRTYEPTTRRGYQSGVFSYIGQPQRSVVKRSYYL